MVDLQAHVLPGADRGAADEASALAMCRYAAERGVRELVAAPKTDLSEPWDPGAADAALASMSRHYVPHLLIIDKQGAIVEDHPGEDRAFWADQEARVRATFDALL